MAQAQDQLDKWAIRCRDKCGARCCSYITVQIPAPKSVRDLDEISWWLTHHHVIVYVESRRWHLEVRTACKFLTGDKLCGIYEDRPGVCRQYDPKSCEFPARPVHTLEFDSRDEFEGWREKKRKERAARRRAGWAAPARARKT